LGGLLAWKVRECGGDERVDRSSRRNQPGGAYRDPVADRRDAGSAVRPSAGDRRPYASVTAVVAAPGQDVTRIAYVARSHDGADIFTILPDGSRRRRLTFSGDAGGPAWAPGGHRLAYAEDGDIWIAVAANPFDRIKVTSGVAVDADPAWSADGDHLAFTRDGESVVVLDLNSDTERALTLPSDQWPGAMQPTWSPDSSRIAFVRGSSDGDDYDSYRKLFVVNADGTGLYEVPNADPFAYNPSWSPDGTTILYSHQYHGRNGSCADMVMSIHPDGTHASTVLKQGCTSEAGSWSPTGLRVALTLGGPVYDSEAADSPKLAGLWTVRPDGTGRRHLVVRHGWDPAWQPKALSKTTAGTTNGSSNLRGRRLAFTATSSNGWDIFTVRPDGKGLRRLTHRGDAVSPSWSPRHRRIAYVTNDAVWVMGAGGGHKHKVGAEFANDPTWAPDGRHLALSWFFDILIANLRTGHVRALNLGVATGHPSWSPDGRWLAFSAYPGFTQSEIYLVRPDGSGLHRITWTVGSETEPTWSPDGRRIAFAYAPPDIAETDARTMRSDGLGSQIVSETTGMDYSPVWSPNGRRIAFYSEGPFPYGHDPQPGLWVSNPDGGHHRLILEKREILDVDW